MLRTLARAGLLALVALIALPTLAPAGERNFSQRFSKRTPGDIRIAANTVLSCPGTCAAADDASGGPTSGAHDTTKSNNGFTMRWVDADGTTRAGAQTLKNSSSARLDLPPGAHVEWAGL